MDLTLGCEITVPMPGTYAYDLTMQPTPLATFIRRNSVRHTIAPEMYFVLEQNQFILAQTRETVGLPIDHPDNRKTGVCLAARIEGKSSRTGSACSSISPRRRSIPTGTARSPWK